MAYTTAETLVHDGLLTIPETIAFLRLSRSLPYSLMVKDRGSGAVMACGPGR